MLESLGFRRAWGVTGGPIAPICHELGRSRLEALHCRHESGAAFAALEDSLASGAPAAVFVTTGPGITNALTGMCAARWEGGRVLLISASTSRREVGRRAFQETSDATLPQAGLFGPGRSSTTRGASSGRRICRQSPPRSPAGSGARRAGSAI